MIYNLIFRKKFMLMMLLFNVIAIFIWLQPSYILLVVPREQGILNPGAEPLAYLYVVLGLVSLIAIYYIYKGKKNAVLFFLCTLSFITAYSVRENIFLIDFFISEYHQKPNFIFTPSVWWTISAGLRWVIWLWFNCWYLVSVGSQFIARDNASKTG